VSRSIDYFCAIVALACVLTYHINESTAKSLFRHRFTQMKERYGTDDTGITLDICKTSVKIRSLSVAICG
jgi:hypothetical protein